jgi:hypothetical protein
MRRIRARTTRRTDAVAEDLLVFRARMEACGVKVRLPTASSDYELPEPFTVEGEPLSETVVRLRDRQA